MLTTVGPTLFEICNTNYVSVMQESIDRAVDWTQNNFMKINSKNLRKWSFVLRQTILLGILYRALSLRVILSIVETVEYAQLLGVTLSNDLTWNMHVDCIVKKGCQTSVYVISVKESRH